MTAGVTRLGLIGGMFALVATLGASGAARAEGEAGRRAFVDALSKRASIRAAHAAEEARKAANAAARAEQHKESRLARLSRVPKSAGTNTGASALSPLTPTGNGLGRDLFINYFYPGALNRPPVESELQYWSGLLAQGVSPKIIADDIWTSQERRMLVSEGLAPNYSLGQVYIWSIDAANANK